MQIIQGSVGRIVMKQHKGLSKWAALFNWTAIRLGFGEKLEFTLPGHHELDYFAGIGLVILVIRVNRLAHLT